MTNPNDTAFPASPKMHDCSGLTVREYFAAAAMQGIIAGLGPGGAWDTGVLARLSVEQADALTKALNTIPAPEEPGPEPF